MDRAQLQKKVKTIKNLPTLPVIAMQVNDLLNDMESPIEQLVTLLEKDQSLVTKILRLVNSSFYGFKSRVNSVRHAVTLMGYNTIRNAIVTVSVIEALNLKTKNLDFNIDQFWRHSIRVAVMCRYIAENSKVAEPEDAFTAGLVHDIGKVVLAVYFTDELSNILEVSANQGDTFFRAEEKLNYCPHNIIGSLLAQHWKLPDTLIKAIQYHHSTVDRSEKNLLIGVVDAGNRLVHMMASHPGYSLISGPDAVLAESVRHIMECLKKKEDWLHKIKGAMDEACQFFNKGKNSGKK
jgi:putative nucleotidyltransferase with HDIG domain